MRKPIRIGIDRVREQRALERKRAVVAHDCGLREEEDEPELVHTPQRRAGEARMDGVQGIIGTEPVRFRASRRCVQYRSRFCRGAAEVMRSWCRETSQLLSEVFANSVHCTARAFAGRNSRRRGSSISPSARRAHHPMSSSLRVPALSPNISLIARAASESHFNALANATRVHRARPDLQLRFHPTLYSD
jgi:hypothetical protein